MNKQKVLKTRELNESSQEDIINNNSRNTMPTNLKQYASLQKFHKTKPFEILQCQAGCYLIYQLRKFFPSKKKRKKKES